MICQDWRPGRFIVKREEPLRVPDLILKSVGFLVSIAAQTDDGIECDLEASGFFVGIPCEKAKPYSHFYFVTASHSVPKNSTVAVRVNLKGGGTKVAELGPKHVHPSDENADVTVFEFGNRQEYDVLFLSENVMRNRVQMAAKDIGVGDEVYFPSLFHFAQGDVLNEPMLRQGSLAMLPATRVQTEAGFMEAYLIEARSIGGISGSAVFARMLTGQARSIHGLSGEVHLIGMIHGHWDVKESELNYPRIQPVDRGRLNTSGINMGIAIVVPIEKVIETLHQPVLQEQRRVAEEEYLKGIRATADRAIRRAGLK